MYAASSKAGLTWGRFFKVELQLSFMLCLRKGNKTNIVPYSTFTIAVSGVRRSRFSLAQEVRNSSFFLASHSCLDPAPREAAPGEGRR